MNEYTEPTNEDRADWGKLAIEPYMKRTGSGIDTAVRDLIADLGHFFDRDVVPELEEDAHDFRQELDWGYGAYQEELQEESDAEIVGVRIEGELREHDSFDELGYDVALFHLKCFEEGYKLFDSISEEDHEVRRFELDQDALPECPVCKKTIGGPADD